MQLSSGIPEACGYVCWQFDQVWSYVAVKWKSWGLWLCVLVRYTAMQLSSGIPTACGYVCWWFWSGMMLCSCQVEFLGHSAMCAGHFWSGMMLYNCQVEFLGHLAVCAGNFWSGMMLCHCRVAFLWHSAVCAGTFDQVWCYATVKWNSWGI